MNLQIIKYEPKYFEKWNSFVSTSMNGTIFHRLDFLEYHKDKFSAHIHHLMFLNGEALIAVMPMAILEDKGKKVAKSPYGGSFGGIVFQKDFNLSDSQEIMQELKNYLISQSIQNLVVIEAPHVYNESIDESIKYSFLRAGAVLYEADAFNIVPLPDSQEQLWDNMQGRARSTIRKYGDNFIINENVSVDEFYAILLEDKLRLNASPTHSLEDLKYLKKTFPDSITMDIAVHKDTGARAGNCYFRNAEHVESTFYMSQENDAVGLNGTNILVYHALKRALTNDCKWFDFGGSTFGYVIDNIGVSKFKESFGAKGFMRPKYILNLEE